MGTIQTKQRTTVSKAHCTCSKANKETFKPICSWVYFKISCASGIRTLNFFAIFRELAVSFVMGTVNDCNGTLLSTSSFVIGYVDAVLIFEVVLNCLGFD